MGRASRTSPTPSRGSWASRAPGREEGRRSMEEAAGTARPRGRGDGGDGKLGGGEGARPRLQDRGGELGRQLKPLKQQAELALRHEELTREAEGLAVKLSAA